MTHRLPAYAVLLALASAPLPAAAEPGVVEVTVTNVRDARGHVLVAVCTQRDFLQEHCVHNATAPARPGAVVVRVTGVPPGTYAVQAWHDENDNGHIDRDWLGIPREGVGFSRDPSLLTGAPSFGSAAFQVGADGGRTSLRLRYFKG